MTDDNRPLPAATLRALDAIVNGPGRRATCAHPDCVCGTRVPTGAEFDGHKVTAIVQPRDCPQHRPEPTA